jgi:outer membrane protein
VQHGAPRPPLTLAPGTDPESVEIPVALVLHPPPNMQIETLTQAWGAAMVADRGLQAERWNESAADQALQAARAERWPVAGIEGSFTARSDEPAFKVSFEGVPLPTEVFPYAQRENFAARGKIDLPLYTSGRIEHGIAAAEAERTALARETEEAAIDLRMRVAETYVTVLRAQRDVELTECSLRALESHACDVQTRLSHAQALQTDLLTARVSVANARQAVIQAKSSLDSTRAAYNRYLGRPLTAAVRLAELPLESLPGDVEGLTALALHNRPVLARLTSQIQALEHRAESLRATNGPQVTARGEYSYLEDRYQVPEGIAAAGVAVSWNLYDGGRNRHAASALMNQTEALRCRYGDLCSAVALEVRKAWHDADEARHRLDATRDAIQQAEENLRVVTKCYGLGTATNTEVLTAEALRSQTYRNHDNAVYETVLAALRLRRATGEL